MRGSLLRRAPLIAAVLGALMCAACGQVNEPAPPGHDGPVPSVAGQTALNGLQGQVVPDPDGVLGPGTWRLAAFGVVPNPVSPGGKGPAVMVRAGEDTAWIPVETDGDVAALHRRITGEGHQALQGPVSDTWTEFWAGE